ncbi:MAG TPA: GntR family transcriptional regulator [Tepidisphaeraceae bacterium]|jgi:DNA-binding LacI/PurR family transcriptional regulator|nr:GntR family transcriptional regulator [Tepidisphaeraceae bacterium]
MLDVMEKTKLDRVYRHLHGEIVRGRFRTGERLPTEEELADRFGYSRTTVAKAIRLLARRGLVERRRRAGSFVRAGAGVRSQLLGAIICGAAEKDPGSNIFVPIGREIAREAELSGYAVTMEDPCQRGTMDLRSWHEKVAREFIEKQVAGVLMVPCEIIGAAEESISARAAEMLSEAGIPVVLEDRDLCRYPHRSQFDLVGIDNRRAGCIMVEHLLKQGIRRVDFVAADEYGWAQDGRIAGCIDAFHNVGLKFERAWMHQGHPSQPEYIEGIVRDRQVEAILAVNDGIAGEIMRVATLMGRNVPGDLKVMGFDDLPFCTTLPSPLTTIRQPCADLGAMAVRTLFDRMRNPNRRTMDVTLSFELIIRKSCGGVLHTAAPAMIGGV